MDTYVVVPSVLCALERTRGKEVQVRDLQELRPRSLGLLSVLDSILIDRSTVTAHIFEHTPTRRRALHRLRSGWHNW